MSFSLSLQVGGVVVGRHGLLQPGDVVFGHVARQLLDGFQAVAAVAHAPPGMRVHHQVEIRTHGLAHQADRLQILLRAQGRPHLVGAETQLGDSRGFGGVGLGRHVHAGAAVEADVVADPPADQFGNRHAVRLAGQVVERDFDAAIDLGQFRVGAGPFQKLHAQRVGIGQRAVLEERSDHLFDGLLRQLAARPGRVAHQPVVRLHADEHGVALQDGAFAAVKRQADRVPRTGRKGGTIGRSRSSW